MQWTGWLGLAVQIGVGSWLVASAAAKLLNLDRSRQALAAYRLVPARAVQVGPVVLATLEAALGVGLLIGLAPTLTLAATSALFAAFGAGMAVDLLAGDRHACGCGLSEARISWSLVARSGALSALMALLVSIVPTDTGTEIRATPVAVAGAALVTVLLARAYLQALTARSG